MRALAAVLFAVTALATFAPSANAEQAIRVGWWNMATVAGVAAPSPTTPDGGLHVSGGPGQVLAYGAVLYAMPANTSGRLTLGIADAQGTVALQACPTKTVTWPAGGDQPSDKAPAYDCSVARDPGSLSADGGTVTFLVDTFAPTTAGRLSLAIVPASSGSDDPTADQPFSVDLDKPGASSLTVSDAPPAASTSAGVTPATKRPTAAQPAPGRPLAMPVAPKLPETTTSAPAGVTSAPQVAPSTQPANPAPVAVASQDSGSAASRIGSVFGALAILAAFMFWGLGRGLLGGKILSLSSPIRSAPVSRRT